MKTSEAFSLLAKLWELESIAQTANTPEGRWELLQKWLKENPEWEKQINKWYEYHPESAFLFLRDYIAEQAEIPSALMNSFITVSIKQRVTIVIQTIQTLYRERKQTGNLIRKEIA